jgi:hypothetical protein
MTPDNGSYMHAAYALVVVGVLAYVVVLALRGRAMARRLDATRPGGSRDA